MVHDDQPGNFFNAYHDHHCYFPLHGFCSRHLLEGLLRTSKSSDSRRSRAIRALLVKLIRQHWSGTHILLRGDSRFYRLAY